MKKSYSPFTLIELLIVVAIIGILASLLLTALGAVRKKSQVAVCTNNLKQAGYAIAMYLDDNGGYYPGAGAYDTKISYDDLLAGYDSRKMTKTRMTWDAGTEAPFMTKQYKCPLDTVPIDEPLYQRRTYVITQAYNGASSSLAPGLIQKEGGDYAMKITHVNEASNTVVLWEFTSKWNKVGNGGQSVKSPGGWNMFGGVSTLDPSAVYNNFFHHNKKAGGNYLMGDGSVRSMNFFSTLSTVKSDSTGDGEYRGTIWDSGLPKPAW